MDQTIDFILIIPACILSCKQMDGSRWHPRTGHQFIAGELPTNGLTDGGLKYHVEGHNTELEAGIEPTTS